jgi:signal transduction histidine kinase
MLPFVGDLNVGFSDQVAWVRLALPESREEYLSVGPIYMDYLSVYRERDGRLQEIFVGGDSVAVRSFLTPHFYAVELPKQSHIDDIFWIQIRSKNLIHVTIENQTHNEVSGLHAFISAALTIALGVTLSYLFWAMFSLYVQYSHLVMVFAVQASIYCITLLVHTGVLRGFLAVDGVLQPQDYSHNFLALVSVASSQLFEIMMVRETAIRRWGRIGLELIFGASIAKFAVFLFGDVSLSLLINNLGVVIFAFFGLLACALPSKNRTSNISTVFVLAYFASICLPVLYFWVTNTFFELPNVNVLAYWFYIYTVIPNGIIVVILSRRQRKIIEQGELMRSKIQEAELSAKLESSRREETKNLLAMLLHEVKTPLATLELSMGTPTIESQSIARRSIDSIVRILRQIDRYDEYGEGQVVLDLQNINAVRQIESIASEYDQVEIASEDREIEIATDASCLHIILDNLVRNASKYKRESSAVRITVANLGDEIEIRLVNDIGELGAPDPARVFEKYYREPAAHRHAGTGLGLYLSRELATKLGGSLSYDRNGSEVMFTLRLPSLNTSGREGLGLG